MSTRLQAISIVQRLRAEGYECLLAGGCVRDMLLTALEGVLQLYRDQRQA